MPCRCARYRFVRSIEEDDPDLPNVVVRLAATKDALLGYCRHCGTWWERLPHEVYGYAWYQTEQGYWDAADEQLAAASWATNRREQGF
jgi:hypothetical protein